VEKITETTMRNELSRYKEKKEAYNEIEKVLKRKLNQQ
jgi:hypothetical protein